MRLKTMLVALLLVTSCISSASDDDDFLLSYVSILAATLGCDPGEFDACRSATGCREINGFWQRGVCVAKSTSFNNTALLSGRWFVVTSFSNGDFFNFLDFAGDSIQSISSSSDYFLTGTAHTSAAFNDANPNDALVSFDSSNQDWFILDYWGRDIGTISSIELNRVSDSLFTGCEFYLNYPDLTYQDGVCNPVRMTRGGFFKSSAAPILLARPRALDKQLPQRDIGSVFRSTTINSLR